MPTLDPPPRDPSWAAHFVGTAARLGEALGGLAVRIDHIGSTAFGVAAAEWAGHPVVDVQVSVPDAGDLGSYRLRLEEAGFTLVDATEEVVLFRSTRPGPPTDVRVCTAGGAAERAGLLVTAFLAAHPVHRDSYLAHRLELSARVGTAHGDPATLAGAKAAFFEAVLEDAERWARRHGWSP